ncbi:MAG: MFS transporter [Promethearchaeota archaeon]
MEKNSNKEQEIKILKHSKFTTIAFGFGAMTDQMSHQAFQLLVFTFYYGVVGIKSTVLAFAFIIFAIWDSINDPLIGPISDKTHSRFGRRGFWILVSIVPFGIINLLLFTPPIHSETVSIVYMIIIIMLYDLVYTMFSSNQTALFPEMFETEKERSKANMYKNILTIIGVLLGFVLPTAIISPLVPDAEHPVEIVSEKYIENGVILCILVIIFGILFFKFGVKERPQELIKPKEALPIWQSLKETMRNKAFIIFVIANLFIWFVFKLLTTIISLYGIYVLGIGKGDFLLSLMLLVAFLSAALCFPLMQKIGLKIGMRNGLMLSQTIWIFTLIPFWFLDNKPGLAIFCMIFVGIGLSGAMYYVDINIGNIIDEDELRTGKRREGSYYGVNALINRYSTILVFVSIASVLSGYGWDEFLINADITQIEGLVIGLKILMVIFPIGGILITLLCLKIFSIHGERLRKIKEELKKIREQQLAKLNDKSNNNLNSE